MQMALFGSTYLRLVGAGMPAPIEFAKMSEAGGVGEVADENGMMNMSTASPLVAFVSRLRRVSLEALHMGPVSFGPGRFFFASPRRTPPGEERREHQGKEGEPGAGSPARPEVAGRVSVALGLRI